MTLENGIAQLVGAFIVAEHPSSCEQNIDDRRTGYIASTVLAGDTETRIQVEDIELDVMIFRIVSPRGSTGDLPCVIYYHGDCFINGGFATRDNQLRQLTWHSGCRVITVQHRLTPEHIFPAAHNDAKAGANTIWECAQKLGADRSNITLAGDGADGYLALVTALRLRASGQWQPAQLMLIYLVLDATTRFASYDHNGQDYVTTRGTLLPGYEMYTSQTDLLHPGVSPL